MITDHLSMLKEMFEISLGYNLKDRAQIEQFLIEIRNLRDHTGGRIHVSKSDIEEAIGKDKDIFGDSRRAAMDEVGADQRGFFVYENLIDSYPDRWGVND